MLGLYANHASVVEAENFFSGIPKPDRITEWVVQSPEDFKFDVVAFGGLTLYQRRPGAADRGVKSWREVAVEPPDVLFEDLCASVQPLKDARRLGAIILQFPPWFEAGPEAHEYLARVREQLEGFPLAVEFRHPTWGVPVNRDSTMDVLIELELGVVISDFRWALMIGRHPLILQPWMALRLFGFTDRTQRLGSGHLQRRLRP